jgi:flagellar M-ring protein FliF
MEKLREYWNRLLSWFSPLPLWKKIAVIGLPLLLMITLLGVAYFATPHYSVLFSNMDPSTIQSVEYTLSRMGVDYKIDYKKGIVYVPSDKVEELRILLAEKGIISPEKKVGFEIFEKQPLTVSEFVEHVNYIRALEGELEKTIKAIDTVEDVKVNIALPKESIFARPEEEPRASVLIKLRPGADLTPEQIKAIRNLLVSSVVGLKPENVTIVDQYGRDLTELIDETDTLAGLAKNQLQLKLKYEKKLKKEIENILSSVVGFGNAKVKVNLVLDFSQKKEKQYEVNPDKTAIVSQQKEKKTKKTVEPVGVPGTESNIPPGKGKLKEALSTEQSKKSITNYEVSYVEKLINDPTIRVKKISIGVIINNEVKSVSAEKIKEFLVNALGLNPQRGDTVTVVKLPFEGKKAIEAALAKAKKGIDWRIYAAAAVAAVLALGGLAGYFYFRRKEKEEEEKIVYGTMVGAPAGAAAVTEKTEESVVQKLQRLAKENPELYKKLVLNWLKSQS